MLGTLHTHLIFPRRVQVLLDMLDGLLPPDAKSVLDLGAGDGQLAKGLSERRPRLSVTAMDSHPRAKTHFDVTIYDGARLPSADASFDWVMLSDVVHHAADPVGLLREASRVARHGLILKDHLAENRWDTLTLLFMDIVGNRRFGVAMGVGYFPEKKWHDVWRTVGLSVERFETKVPLYPFPMSAVFGRGLHFVARLRKAGSTP